jgi:hypothetical protein
MPTEYDSERSPEVAVSFITVCGISALKVYVDYNPLMSGYPSSTSKELLNWFQRCATGERP